MKRGCSGYTLHLYGSFVGVDMKYGEVCYNFHRMWRKYDIGEISLDDNGFGSLSLKVKWYAKGARKWHLVGK